MALVRRACCEAPAAPGAHWPPHRARALQSDGTAADTNLRVLVTHYNGMQEVVAVEDDMGLDPRNTEAIKARLREQGVKDIMTVETE